MADYSIQYVAQDKRHFVVAEFEEGIDPLKVAAGFDELLIKKCLISNCLSK